MKIKTNRRKHLLYVWMMGICTIFLSLVVADGMFGLNQPPTTATRGFVGFLFFWRGMIVLPLLFYKRIKWRDTFLNLALYFLLYFPVYDMFGLKLTHSFLERGGFFAFPSYMGAILVAVVFWGIQSIVFLVINIICYVVRKNRRKSERTLSVQCIDGVFFSEKKNIERSIKGYSLSNLSSI